MTDSATMTNSPPSSGSSSSVRLRIASAGDRTAQRERPGVPHEDLARAPCSTTGTRGTRRCRRRRTRRGRADLVRRSSAAGRRCSRAAVLPDRQQGVRAEREQGGAGGQPVEPVGEVDRVRRRRDEEPDPDHEQRGGQHQPGVPEERDARARPGSRPVSSGNCSARPANASATAAWPSSFVRPRTPDAALLEDLEVVVGHPDQPSPTHSSSASRPETLGARQVSRCAPEVAEQDPREHRERRPSTACRACPRARDTARPRSRPGSPGSSRASAGTG